MQGGTGCGEVAFKLMIFDVRGRVTEARFLNSKIKFVRASLNGEFEFKAGQFVNVEVGPNFYRAYSIASHAQEKNFLEFVVDITPGGKGSQFFEKLKAEDPIHIKGPFGRLVLPEINSGNFCFIATGTGVAPFRSMAFELLAENVSLFWGLRYKEDIFFEEEFKNLKKFCISLSRPSDWNGEVGHITDYLIREDFRPETLFFLCGNQGMIDDARKILLEKGVKDEKIRFEKFY